MPGFNYRMTELQAAVGLSQIKKLDFIIKESKKRFNLLNQNFSKKFEMREIYSGSEPNYDTIIFKVENKTKRKKIVKYLNKIWHWNKKFAGCYKMAFCLFLETCNYKRSIKKYNSFKENFGKIYCYTNIFKCQFKELQKNFIKSAENH